VEGKAAFNNFPHQYGVTERTFSEYKSGALVQTRVSDFLTLPPELQAGAILEAYTAAQAAGTGGDYEDGTPRYFSCQTCHMQPTTGIGCDKNGVPIRADLPLHDLTGGNTWAPLAVEYLDGVGKLRLGGGMSSTQIADLLAGASRAAHQLDLAASLEADGFALKIINLTGHKLISGYPEGRRMWLHIEWYDDQDVLLREDGAYGPLVDGNGQPVEVVDAATGLLVQVDSILDLEDPNLRIYEAHYGLTQEWANQLLGLGSPASLPLQYDRHDGSVDLTLGDLGAQSPGSKAKSFHFVLNNTILEDNRIPTYGMRYDDARERNALPVPPDQYGDPGPGGVYAFWDDVDLHTGPIGAVRAEISLLYQTTSWEYIQFLQLANDGSVAFLADEGDNLLEAWINTGMSQPYEMASTTAVPEPGMAISLAAGVIVLVAGTATRRRSSTASRSPA
jgi:hypothetical protein